MTRLVSMSSTFKATFFAVVGCAAFAGAAPAFAASAATDAFVATVHPNVDFLDHSSRLAIETSSNAETRAFARGEATDQTLVGNQLVAWALTGTVGSDAVLTGRSVAIDTPVDVVRPRTAAPGTLLPSGEADMTNLARMKGRRFDFAYTAAQKATLTRLATLYTDYARSGDDPALRTMAERQLPLVRHRLAQLAAR